MSEFALSVDHLSGGIDSFLLQDINFTIKHGTVMGLIGKNGAGKTTLIQTLAGFLPRTDGTILFDGLPLRGNELKIRSDVAFVFDTLLFPIASTPKNLVKTFAPFYKDFDYEKFWKLLDYFGLPKKKRLFKFSKGMRSIFGIIFAICQNPKLIVMDEPTSGLDPSTRQDILDILHEFVQDENKSILFSTHITSDLEKIADYITYIDNGKTVFTKSVIEITDEMFLCRLDKNTLPSSLNKYVLGCRETPFGLECLITDKTEFLHIQGVQFARPTIEDVMTHREMRDQNDPIY